MLILYPTPAISISHPTSRESNVCAQSMMKPSLLKHDSIYFPTAKLHPETPGSNPEAVTSYNQVEPPLATLSSTRADVLYAVFQLDTINSRFLSTDNGQRRRVRNIYKERLQLLVSEFVQEIEQKYHWSSAIDPSSFVKREGGNGFLVTLAWNIPPDTDVDLDGNGVETDNDTNDAPTESDTVAVDGNFNSTNTITITTRMQRIQREVASRIETHLLPFIKLQSVDRTCLRGGVHIAITDARSMERTQVAKWLHTLAFQSFAYSYPSYAVERVDVDEVIGKYFCVRSFLQRDYY